MNVKLAVVFAVACLSLVGLSIANSDNTDYDSDDQVMRNTRVVCVWGRNGGKLRVFSMYAPHKFIQFGHLVLAEQTAAGAPVFLKNNKGRDTKTLRAVNLATARFTWTAPTITTTTDGRTVASEFSSSFTISGLPVTVVFKSLVSQTTSSVNVNGVAITREKDDVQFSIEISDWPFAPLAGQKNALSWTFALLTNVPGPTDPTYGGRLFQSVRTVKGRGAFIFQDAICDLPANALIDGVSTPVTSTITHIGPATSTQFHVVVVFPQASHCISYDSIIKVTQLPPPVNGDPSPGSPPPGSPGGDPTPTPPPPAGDSILGTAIPYNMPVDPAGTTASTAFRRVSVNDPANPVTLILYPAQGAMRLYAGLTPDVANDDYIQITQSLLQEVTTDPTTGAYVPLAGKSVDFTAAGTTDSPVGTWREGDITATYLEFVYEKTVNNLCGITGAQLDFIVKARLYQTASAAAAAGTGGGDSIGGAVSMAGGVQAGALKFTVMSTGWLFQDTNSFLNWQINLQTRSDAPSGVPTQLQTPTALRFNIPQGNYDVQLSNILQDNTDGIVWPNPISVEYAYVNYFHTISHYFPPVDFQFDPVLQLPRASDPTYPPYVAPATTAPSVIRDPRSQFSAASRAAALAPMAAIAAAVVAILAAKNGF